MKSTFGFYSLSILKRQIGVKGISFEALMEEEN